MEMLGGGLMYGDTMEFYGSSGCGKTQVLIANIL